MENLSNNAVFAGNQPVQVNTGTHSAKTNLGILSSMQSGLVFGEKKGSNATLAANAKGKRSLQDYNDLIQVRGHHFK